MGICQSVFFVTYSREGLALQRKIFRRFAWSMGEKFGRLFLLDLWESDYTVFFPWSMRGRELSNETETEIKWNEIKWNCIISFTIDDHKT